MEMYRNLTLGFLGFFIGPSWFFYFSEWQRWPMAIVGS